MHNESEYAFICLHFASQPTSLIKKGILTFQEHILQNNDFEIRETIIRSSFSGIYGNYHIKLALILNVIGNLCGFPFSSLIIGEISTGKSSLAKELIHLFTNECRLINGALTNPKAFSSSKI